jgi:hypothetical protein
VDEELNSRTQIDPDKVRKIGQASKKKTSRMVMAKRR